ncbi:hypothetical protein B0H17DRAFT_927741 [Mycena rosella]|uniref:Myb/SANT-like domain-containing protein n=1 Tax=Mycena rosella TaxID=1033263 RepID=A0AAD7DSI5_MYCRO|nr:hypothetical protein B0H17DRAFT_927741 [Mycena rosella]
MAVEKFSGAGDNVNFGKPFWTSVAADLNQQLTKGAPKDADSCKSKYNKLKLVYSTVHEIIQNSGWAWENECGACIGSVNEGTWDAYVEKNPKAAPFRNARWIHLEAFQMMIPADAPACGETVHLSMAVPRTD